LRSLPGFELTIFEDSEISTDDEDEIPDEETLADRISALRDIIPPTTRSYIASKVETTTSWIWSGTMFAGKTLWVVSTSALLLGVPYALAFAEEQQWVEMEKEMKMRESGAEVCFPLNSLLPSSHYRMRTC
jgi:import receptor subunit TOM22